MTKTDEKLFTIGAVARMSGVPIKTIRHYSDIGVLPPSGSTEAGYRLYSDDDRIRLDMIRTLRLVGFDLPTIGSMLGGERSPTDALNLQLAALDVQMSAIRRQQALLRTALKNAQDGDSLTLTYLRRAGSLERLNTVERERFLRDHMEKSMADVPVDPEWKAAFMSAAFANFPDELDETQLEAWLELAALTSDDSFLRRINELSRPFWEAAGENSNAKEWSKTVGEVFHLADDAAHAGHSPASASGQEVIEKLLCSTARVMRRTIDPPFAEEVLAQYKRGYEPRAERFWELVALIRGQDPAANRSLAYPWLIAGLRIWIARARANDSARSEE